jgi:hypothetical protein
VIKGKENGWMDGWMDGMDGDALLGHAEMTNRTITYHSVPITYIPKSTYLKESRLA